MAAVPTLYVCDGDDGGPKLHPCRRVQEALRAAHVEYIRIVAAHGSPFPCLRGSREQLFRELGTRELPTMKLPDGTLLINPAAILTWVAQQQKLRA